jgi:hypothetical protein
MPPKVGTLWGHFLWTKESSSGCKPEASYLWLYMGQFSIVERQRSHVRITNITLTLNRSFLSVTGFGRHCYEVIKAM